jgi:hypothetical protein
MAQGQVQGGALQVREAHKSINLEGCPQRFRGDRESIPTTNANSSYEALVGRAVPSPPHSTFAPETVGEAAWGHAALPNFQLPQTNSTGFAIRGSKLW